MIEIIEIEAQAPPVLINIYITYTNIIYIDDWIALLSMSSKCREVILEYRDPANHCFAAISCAQHDRQLLSGDQYTAGGGNVLDCCTFYIYIESEQ